MLVVDSSLSSSVSSLSLSSPSVSLSLTPPAPVKVLLIDGTFPISLIVVLLSVKLLTTHFSFDSSMLVFSSGVLL